MYNFNKESVNLKLRSPTFFGLPPPYKCNCYPIGSKLNWLVVNFFKECFDCAPVSGKKLLEHILKIISLDDIKNFYKFNKEINYKKRI